MTWCVTETHHLSVIQVFELQGCNVARLVWKDLFQIAGPEGSVAVHVGGFSEQKCGRNETTCRNKTVEAEKRNLSNIYVSNYHIYLFIDQCWTF